MGYTTWRKWKKLFTGRGEVFIQNRFHLIFRKIMRDGEKNLLKQEIVLD